MPASVSAATAYHFKNEVVVPIVNFAVTTTRLSQGRQTLSLSLGNELNTGDFTMVRFGCAMVTPNSVYWHIMSMSVVIAS